MTQFTGTVRRIAYDPGTRSYYGYIGYRPEDVEEDEDDEQIYFIWKPEAGEAPREGSPVMFDQVLDEDKIAQSKAEGKNEIFYIAKNVAVTK